MVNLKTMIKKDVNKAYVAATLNATLIGLTFLFTKYALVYVEPFEVLSLKFIIAFTFLTLILKLGVKKVNFKKLFEFKKEMLALGIFQPVLFFGFQVFGINYLGVAQVGILYSIAPVVTTIFGILILKETINLKQAIFMSLSIIGIIYIYIMRGIGGYFNPANESNILGVIFILVSIFATSMYAVSSRKLSKNLDPITITYGMMLIGAIVFTALNIGISAFYGVPNIFTKLYVIGPELLNSNFISSILYLGIVVSVITSFLVNYSLSKIKAAEYSIISKLSVVVSIISAIIFMNETVALYQIIGVSAVILGVIGANYYSEH
ncbi:DMT family transporter [Methanococcus voltae]|uniref:Drug/metabolite transporter (DMT)-like permease n=2 Tax=Methanococcus voltae TaxID=2188 RepID=A0A8J7USS2_METVO|nr:DMT family transporter [Methanococcus voltae]MBP2172987.1 drug/metabolite transporter (DMT)-like permease [Methanococcus voltae]MBP2201957.1 drug/metabolite transporter (DMT)-like permease [Methanococcus voltae]MCS3922121.1 drug/metabolite transporter (DMT)-like permease [Methanococcus voltae PS]